MKYFWVRFNIKDFKPNYNPNDTTFYLTSVAIYLYNSQAGQICTLWVFNASGEILHRLASPVLGGSAWNEFSLPYIPINDDSFTVVIFLPTRRTGNRYRTLPYWDNGANPDRKSGWILNGTYYINNDRDLNLRAIGRFAPSGTVFHDVAMEGLYYPSPFIVGVESNTLFFRLFNYGEVEETNVPATLYFGVDTQRVTIPSLPVFTYTDVAYPNFSFTPKREELYNILGGYVSLNNDTNFANDTLEDYSFYQFPKYTYLAQEFEFPQTFPPENWSSIDANNDGEEWWFKSSIELAHSGKFYAISPSASNSDDWLFTPAIAVDSNYNTSFGFYVRALNQTPVETLRVYITSSPTNNSIIDTIFNTVINDVWTRFTSSLDRFRGQTVYIAFRESGTSSNQILLDDIFVRKVPLGENQVLREEFEEILCPPGWRLTNDLWFGVDPADVSIPDNGTGHIFCFNSATTPGVSSELVSPLIKIVSNNNAIYYTFKYYNSDGSDSLQIWYRFGGSQSWTYHRTLTTTSGWVEVISDNIPIPTKQTLLFEIKLVGFSDGGSSYIAIDDFQINTTNILGVNCVVPASIRINNVAKGIKLQALGIKSGVLLDVFDSMGRKVHSLKIYSDGKYEFNGLMPGVYFIRLSGDVNTSYKILIVR